MKFLALTPMIQTEDMDETIRFYTEVLGFTLDNKDDGRGMARLSKDHAAIVVSTPGEHEEISKAIFTGSFYFRVDDADAAWEALRSKAAICYPLETFEYGMREFAVYDNNGYILQFGREVDRKDY